MNLRPITIAALILGASGLLSAAELQVAGIFSDHAVLQQGMAVPVWGTADPGTPVTVVFAGQRATAKTGADGRWTLSLAALKASEQPADLTITAGAATITRRDLLVGEVWLASGQSNMAVPVSALPEAAAVLAKAADPGLRVLTMPRRTAAEPSTAVGATWAVAATDSIKGVSAVGYIFARDLRQARRVPVGLIVASWGGTSIQTWMGLEALHQDPPLTKFVDQWTAAVAKHSEILADPAPLEAYRKDLKAYQDELAALRKTAGAAAKPERPEPVNPDPMDIPSPSRRPSTPTVNFNGLIAPLVPFALRGFLWYQGENDASYGRDYRVLLPRLIGDWRSRWKQAEVPPFLFVQLPSNGPDATPVAEKGWPFLREAQFLALATPRTGMAITIDVGNPKDVHPAGKVPVGQRLALSARKIAYGEAITGSGPLYDGFTVEPDGAVRIRFRETGTGLVPGQSPWYAPGVEPYPTDRLIGFVIAGADRKWQEATAVVDGATVLVRSPAVPQPTAVRYGWANSPRCNLYNREGLPASPFRTDVD